MKKIAFVTGSRADYGIVRRYLDLLNKDDDIDLKILVTGALLSETYGNQVKLIYEDGFDIAAEIKVDLDSSSNKMILHTMAQTMEGFADHFATNRYDLLIILGDRYEMLSVATAAAMQQLPILHIHGGEATYGKSKLAGEELFFEYGKECGAKVLVYRFPNLFGKWCRPNYNSAVATFCNNIANNLPIQVNDRATELELLYIDDLVEEMLDALEGKEHHCEYQELDPVADESGKYGYVPTTHKATLGEIVDLLEMFKNQPKSLLMPEIPNNSFAKKLYSTYLSYLPKEEVSFPLKMNVDDRGSFTELLKTANCGQFSVNISKPGITKGEHWHNSKWEFFIVVSGHGLIQERKIGTDEVIEFEVSGEKIEAIHMLPGYTHNIINLSEIENLVTVMWANEQFDPNHPDTFFERVKN